MKLSRLLRKPAWEHRDDGERTRAVGTSNEPELLAQLDQLARTDPAPGVRSAALRRLGDLALLADRMVHDTDAEVRQIARQRLGALMYQANAEDTVQAATRVLRVLEDAAFDLDIARHAQAPGLRRIAYERIAKPGFLLERCQHDPDADIRAELLLRIDSAATLERLAEATRKTDKTLSRLARERAQSTRLAAGEPAALRQRVLDIAESFDRLRRERPENVHAQADALIEEWQRWRRRVDADLARRVDGYAETLRASLNYVRPAQDAGAPSSEEPVVADAATATASAEPISTLVSTEDTGASSTETAPPDPEILRRETEARAQREAAHAARQAAAEQARVLHERCAAAMDELEQALAGKQLSAARAAHARIEMHKREPALTMSERLLARWRRAEQELEGLARWQHWANNKVRARLCDELQAVIGTGLHPDAVALKVKQTQAQWQQLEQSELMPGADALAESGLDKRFRALCHRLLAPTRAYFDKRDELRGQRRQELDALLQRAEAQSQQSAGASVAALRRDLVTWLRRLDELDPRDRTSAGKRLRELLTRCDQARAAHDEQTQQGKHKLIANLRRKLAQADLDEALDLCKAAQAQWRELPRAARESEQALKQEFDALVEPWFKKAQQLNQAQADAVAERERGLNAVLQELNALAAGDEDQLKHAATQLAQLSNRWRELRMSEREPGASAAPETRKPDRRSGPGDRHRRDDARRPRAGRAADPMEQRYDAAVLRVQQALRERDLRHEREWLQQLGAAAQCCIELEALPSPAESAAAWQARWQAIALPAAAHALHARFERAVLGERDDAARASATAQSKDLVVLAELLAGVDSPPHARETRRALQVTRLQARLSGAVASDTTAELREVYQRWCATGPLRSDVANALAERMHRAARSLLESTPLA